jgi:glycosyltransferase involved in cell wall biosynthesis
MTVNKTDSYNWQKGNKVDRVRFGGKASPNVEAFKDHLLKRYGGTSVGIVNKREVRGGGSLSTHYFGAAIDWRYPTRAAGKRAMKEFVDNGGTLAMVSQWQYDGMNDLSKRVRDRELELNGGLINSAFCTGDEQTSTQIDYDCVTIGRVDKEKDPFLLHKLAGKSDLKSLVLTSAYDLLPVQQEYLDKNKHWEGNRETKFNLKHVEVMDHLSRSGVYLSTCPRETWGITALEAFARGIPVVLFRLAANKNKHASEDIAPGPEFYEAMTNKTEKDFKLAVDKLLKVDRMELSQKTKEKHSKENWVQTLNNLIDKAIENKKQHQKPVSWFD